MDLSTVNRDLESLHRVLSREEGKPVPEAHSDTVESAEHSTIHTPPRENHARKAVKKPTAAAAALSESQDEQDEGRKRSKYAKISEEDRTKLVELVLKHGKSIQEASRELNINISTGKGILTVYMKEGRVGKKKTRDRPTNVITNFIMAKSNPYAPNQQMYMSLGSTIQAVNAPAFGGNNQVTQQNIAVNDVNQLQQLLLAQQQGFVQPHQYQQFFGQNTNPLEATNQFPVLNQQYQQPQFYNHYQGFPYNMLMQQQMQNMQQMSQMPQIQPQMQQQCNGFQPKVLFQQPQMPAPTLPNFASVLNNNSNTIMMNQQVPTTVGITKIENGL